MMRTWHTARAKFIDVEFYLVEGDETCCLDGISFLRKVYIGGGQLKLLSQTMHTKDDGAAERTAQLWLCVRRDKCLKIVW